MSHFMIDRPIISCDLVNVKKSWMASIPNLPKRLWLIISYNSSYVDTLVSFHCDAGCCSNSQDVCMLCWIWVLFLGLYNFSCDVLPCQTPDPERARSWVWHLSTRGQQRNPWVTCRSCEDLSSKANLTFSSDIGVTGNVYLATVISTKTKWSYNK